MENLTPVKSKPLNRLTHNLSGLITSMRGTFVPNLVLKNPFFSALPTSGQCWNVTVNLCDFFSRTNVEKRPLDGFWRAMAQKTWNRASMCLVGVIMVIKWKIEIWPLFTPKTQKWHSMGNFQPKWPKYQISKTQDGGRPPFWKWFYRYISVGNHPISTKFGMYM